MHEQGARILIPNYDTDKILIITSNFQGGNKEYSTDFYTCDWLTVEDNAELFEYLDNVL